MGKYAKKQFYAHLVPMAYNFQSCPMPSTVVAHMDYDAARLLLTIRFVSGAIYEYHQVPETVFLSLKQSREKGIYLNRFIKGKYNYRKINAP